MWDFNKMCADNWRIIFCKYSSWRSFIAELCWKGIKPCVKSCILQCSFLRILAFLLCFLSSSFVLHYNIQHRINCVDYFYKTPCSCVYTTEIQLKEIEKSLLLGLKKQVENWKKKLAYASLHCIYFLNRT